MKRIDLHVHSTESDGTFTPAEIAFYAKARGLDAIALTDHDTIKGVKRCIEAGKKVDLTVIPGVEFAVQHNNIEIHVLGYNFDIDHPELNATLRKFLTNRTHRNEKMIAQLQGIGLDITMADVEATCQDPEGVITRAHFANALLNKGYVSTVSDAFHKYLSSGRPGYVSRAKVSPSECIRLIHAAGGVAVLAHPMLYGLSFEDTVQLIKELKAIGLDGVEVIYPEHSKENIIDLFNVCLQNNLVPTGGSDFHGVNKPHLDIGVGYGNTKVPVEILVAIYAKQAIIHG